MSTTSREQVASLLRRCLQSGSRVEIDGLGVFRPAARDRYEFVPQTRPRVFIAYAQEDAAAAERLYHGFLKNGYQPWLDRKKLLPGQNWPRAIEEAIEVSDFFVACFSRQAAGRRGWFQSELRYAMDCARRLPLDEMYIIPARLEDCRVPARISGELQYVDLFPDWEKGFQRMLAAMRRPAKRSPAAGDAA